MSDLRLIRGKNNGIIGGVLYTKDVSGSQNIFNLTATTVSMEIYDDAGDVQATINGVVENASTGTYTIKPDANDLDSLSHGQNYKYRVIATNTTYPEGLAFDTDSDGRELRCTII